MSEEFHQLGNLLEPFNLQSLKLAKARALFLAVEQNPFFDLIELRTSTGSNGRTCEILIVDCVCNSGGKYNSVGIDARERLALFVSDDPSDVPEAWVMRKTFPDTGHQNHVPTGMPASLCLYAQTKVATARTWTAQQHLRRIQWWLENTAEGTLHENDPAPEQFYFNSDWTLVLPLDFNDKVGKPNYGLVFTKIVERSIGRATLMGAMREVGPNQMSQSGGSFCLAIELDPVVGDRVERDPTTLGELEKGLLARGTSVIPKLVAAIEEFVDQGKRPDPNHNAIVLVLGIPLKKADGEAPVSTQVRAFYVNANPLTLGKKAGCLFEDNGSFYRDFMGKKSFTDVTEWTDIGVEPLEITFPVTPESARKYSGVTQENMQCTLLGGGALGSTMLECWTRAGWSIWSVIDNDHLKPHNLVRHTATTESIGLYKADAIAADANRLYGGTTELVRPIHENALDLDNPAAKDALSKSDLIVDATTTLEVPRKLAGRSELKRCVSAFLTPNGNHSVLLAEDRDRKIRIDHLECQYYRGLINTEMGADHLRPADGKFRSGAGCRDISFILSYAQVNAHAANLAEQIRMLGNAPAIRIWTRNGETGEVRFSEITICEPIHTPRGELTVVWDEGIKEKVSAFRKASLPNETGGVLLGYFDFNENKVYVVDALPAPPDSEATPVSFKRGQSDLQSAIDEAHRRTAGVVNYIGEWHSHPDGCRTDASFDDKIQMAHLAEALHQDGLPVLMLIAGDSDVNLILGKVIDE